MKVLFTSAAVASEVNGDFIPQISALMSRGIVALEM